MIKFKRLIKSVKYAISGLIKAFRDEQNLKIQSIFAIFAIIFGFLLQIGKFEWLVVILTIGMVLLMELINSAIERLTDMLKPRLDPYSKEIKDIMAGAVMLASIMAVIAGVIIFVPKIFEKL